MMGDYNTELDEATKEYVTLLHIQFGVNLVSKLDDINV